MDDGPVRLQVAQFVEVVALPPLRRSLPVDRMLRIDPAPPLPALIIPQPLILVAPVIDEGGKLLLGHGAPGDGEGLQLDGVRPLLVIEHEGLVPFGAQGVGASRNLGVALDGTGLSRSLEGYPEPGPGPVMGLARVGVRLGMHVLVEGAVEGVVDQVIGRRILQDGDRALLDLTEKFECFRPRRQGQNPAVIVVDGDRVVERVFVGSHGGLTGGMAQDPVGLEPGVVADLPATGIDAEQLRPHQLLLGQIFDQLEGPLAGVTDPVDEGRQVDDVEDSVFGHDLASAAQEVSRREEERRRPRRQGMRPAAHCPTPTAPVGCCISGRCGSVLSTRNDRWLCSRRTRP